MFKYKKKPCLKNWVFVVNLSFKKSMLFFIILGILPGNLKLVVRKKKNFLVQCKMDYICETTCNYLQSRRIEYRMVLNWCVDECIDSLHKNILNSLASRIRGRSVYRYRPFQKFTDPTFLEPMSCNNECTLCIKKKLKQASNYINH